MDLNRRMEVLQSRTRSATLAFERGFFVRCGSDGGLGACWRTSVPDYSQKRVSACLETELALRTLRAQWYLLQAPLLHSEMVSVRARLAG